MALAFLAALALRLFRLGHQSLWVDEMLTWSSAGRALSLSLGEVLANQHGPLHQVVTHLWTRLAGDSEFALRLPSAVAGALVVPVFAALARRVLGPAARVPAAWMAALAPFLVWYGQEARYYSFGILFATAAALAAVRWHERGGRRDGVFFVLFAWLGVLSNLNAALVLPVLLLYVALPHGGRPGRPWAALAALAALGVLESPWALDAVQRLAWHRLVPGRASLPGEVPLRGPTTFSWGAYPFTFFTYSVGYTLGPSLLELHESPPLRAALAHWPVVAAVAVLFGALTVRGVVALVRCPDRLALAVGLVGVPLAFVTYFAVQNFKVFNPRYAASGLAGYYLILLAGWLALRRPWRRAAGAMVIGVWLVSLGNQYFDPLYGKEDYRSAVAWLAGRVRPGDRLVAANSDLVLEYYWDGRQPPYRSYWLGFAADPARMRARFAPLVSPDSATYVVVTRPYDLDPGRRFESYLRRDLGAETDRFVGVRVYRLGPGAAARAAALSAAAGGTPPPGKAASGGASSAQR